MKPASIIVPMVVVLALLGLATIPLGAAPSLQSDYLSQVGVYLPLVYKALSSPTPMPPTATATQAPTNTPQPTATTVPSVTPQATNTSTPVTFPLVNGDFEQGETGWTFLDGAFATNTAGFARTGAWSALLGGSNRADETLRQRVMVPTDKPYLSFWYTAASQQAGCYYDRIFIWTDPMPNDTAYSRTIVDSIYDFCDGRTHIDYRQKIVDLRAYAGRIIQLDIDMATNAGYASYADIDDVTFVSQP